MKEWVRVNRYKSCWSILGGGGGCGAETCLLLGAFKESNIFNFPSDLKKEDLLEGALCWLHPVIMTDFTNT